MIHDSQYTDLEYPAKRGWGHTTVEWSVDYALAAGVKRLVLFHHDPLRADDALDAVLAADLAKFNALLTEKQLAGVVPGLPTPTGP